MEVLNGDVLSEIAGWLSLLDKTHGWASVCTATNASMRDPNTWDCVVEPWSVVQLEGLIATYGAFVKYLDCAQVSAVLPATVDNLLTNCPRLKSVEGLRFVAGLDREYTLPALEEFRLDRTHPNYAVSVIGSLLLPNLSQLTSLDVREDAYVDNWTAHLHTAPCIETLRVTSNYNVLAECLNCVPRLTRLVAEGLVPPSAEEFGLFCGAHPKLEYLTLCGLPLELCVGECPRGLKEFICYTGPSPSECVLLSANPGLTSLSLALQHDNADVVAGLTNLRSLCLMDVSPHITADLSNLQLKDLSLSMAIDTPDREGSLCSSLTDVRTLFCLADLSSYYVRLGPNLCNLRSIYSTVAPLSLEAYTAIGLHCKRLKALQIPAVGGEEVVNALLPACGQLTKLVLVRVDDVDVWLPLLAACLGTVLSVRFVILGVGRGESEERLQRVGEGDLAVWRTVCGGEPRVYHSVTTNKFTDECAAVLREFTERGGSVGNSGGGV